MVKLEINSIVNVILAECGLDLYLLMKCFKMTNVRFKYYFFLILHPHYINKLLNLTTLQVALAYSNLAEALLVLIFL